MHIGNRTGPLGLVLGFALGVLPLSATPASPEAVQNVVQSLVWTGQSSIRFSVGTSTVAIDPLKIPPGSAKVDLILVTHPHGDHLSQPDLLALADPDRTVVAGPAAVIAQVKTYFTGKTVVLELGKSATLAGVTVLPVPAYNVQRQNKHDKASGWFGYVVDVGGVKLYHSGDTERIPEMKTFGADIALVPLGQTYTMLSVQEAVDSVVDTGASVGIPIHYGMYEGTEADADTFVKLLTARGVMALKLKKTS